MRHLTALAILACFAAACGSDDPPGPGDKCDPGGDACQMNLICTAATDGEDRCQIQLGGECDLSAENDNCEGAAECFATAAAPEGTGSCALPSGTACDPDAAGVQCAEALTCAEVMGGAEPYVCYERVFMAGMVFDAQSTAAIGDAQVIALDAQGTAVTDVAITDVDGNYDIEIPNLVRDDTGAPLAASFTLRASAADYQTFPGGIRTALPVNTIDAVLTDRWTIDTPVTDIALVPLEAAEQGRGSVSGEVLAGDLSAGVLVVVAGESALTDAGGGYTVFNVADGDWEVRGYAAGVQLTPVDITVSGAALTGIDLAESGATLATISGSINIVNAAGGLATSIVLVVQDTFSDTFVRGEVPRGLRTPLSGPPDVTSAWTIVDVPQGQYVVLAAFENDSLVRDPDPNIAGTQIVTITVTGADIAINTAFKVTEALAILGPGADLPEAIAGTPTFTWTDDSGEDRYSISVFNSYGDLVWEDTAVPSVQGNATVTVTYAGPTLETGLYYQFRATSWRDGGGMPGPIATTEDLRGVFFLQ